VRLRSLEADRFRNLRSVAVSLESNLTVLVGKNGQGKSGILESIYLLGTGYSHRTRKFDELIAWDGGPARVSGVVASRRGESRLAVVLEDGERRLVADGIERSLDDFLGRLDVVALPSDGTRVLRDAPETRRRFLDSGIVGLRGSYLKELGDYRRTLSERNALLRARSSRGERGGSDELGAWDERVVEAAARVHTERRAYATRLAAALAQPERSFLGMGASILVRYQPSPAESREQGPGGFRAIFRRALEKERERDQSLGFTAVGPHRDDLRVELGGVDLRRFGSAGQVRAAMVVLSLGKLEVLKESKGDSPVFLMDDFDSDLDEPRARALASYLASGGFQAVLATAKEGFAGRLGVPVRTIRVEAGKAA
jgi:DNA replication and repair protein RecF